MKDVNVVIIGGGIIGCLSALVLNSKGCNVTLLERHHIGSQSSSASAGILFPLLPWDYSSHIYECCKYASTYYQVLSEILKKEIGSDPEFIKSGLLILNPNQKKCTPWLIENNIEYRWEKFRGITSLLIENIFQIKTPVLMKLIKQLLIKRKINVIENFNTKKIPKNINTLKFVSDHKNSKIYGDFFVLTCGAWSGQICEEYKDKIFPVRGQIIKYISSDVEVNRIIYSDGIYILKRDNKEIIVGSSSENVGFSEKLGTSVKNKLKKRAEEIFPALSEVPIVENWCGFRPATNNGMPIEEQSEFIKNLFINTGHFRNGIAMAPQSVLNLEKILNL